MSLVLAPRAIDNDVAGPRVPPHSVEAEQSVLGGLLLENGAWDRVGDLLTESDFYRFEHRLIFTAMAVLVNATKPADVITVFEQLQSLGRAEECGGLAYLNALAQSVPSAANIHRYVEIVHQRATQRKLIAAAYEISTGAFSSSDVAGAVEKAQQLIADVAASSSITTRAKARTLDLRGLAGLQAPARHWFRHGWLGPDPTLLSGVGGGGKTGLMQHEATAGSLGRSYFAPEAQPYRSLILECEGEHDDLWRRQERICQHEGIDLAELDGGLTLVSRYGCDNALMAKVHGSLVTTRLLEELRQQVNDERTDVLWLDNVAHFLHADHDDRIDVTAFINALKGLVQGRPFGVVMLAHISRAQGSEFTGSVAWENAVRMRWFLGTRLPDQRPVETDDEVDTNVRFLCKRKSNYSAKDYVRFTMREGLLVPDEGQQTRVGGLVSALDDRKAEEVCIAGFKSLVGMGIHSTDGKTTADYLPSQIIAKGLGSGFSKVDLTRAMNRLMGAGRFTRGVVGKYANRSPRQGLVLSEGAP